MKTKSLLALIVLGVLALALPASGEAPPGSPYMDLFHGFGLTPPAGAERSNERTVSQLVSWRMRDAKTNAILWTLSVGKVDKVAADDLDAYAKTLAQTLQEKENFKIDSNEVREIAGQKAIDLKGRVEGKQAWWQRQVWVTAKTGGGAAARDGTNFIVLRITGPAGAAESMDATMTAVLATLKIIDPKEAIAQREKNLKAGAEFLKTVTAEKLVAAIQTEPSYVLTNSDQTFPSGTVVTQSASQKQANGIEWRTDIFTIIPGKEMIHAIAKMSTSADRASGTEQVKGQSGTFDSFTQSDWKISYEKAPLTPGALGKKMTKTIPPELRDCYVPPAFLYILPQLLDLKKLNTYGFAIYSETNSFDVYTLTVVGAKKIDIGGKDVLAYQIDIQPAEDAPSNQRYVDEKGRFLRSVGGARAVDKETFFKAFPKAAEMIGKD